MTAQDLVWQQIEQHHDYVQFIAQTHMTWFAFHFTANATGLAYYHERPYLFLKYLFLGGNIGGGIGSALVVLYYILVAEKLASAFAWLNRSAALAAGSNLSDETQLVSPMPLWLWLAVASLLATLCFAFAIGWLLVPEQPKRADSPTDD